jgi:hypothetical protein
MRKKFRIEGQTGHGVRRKIRILCLTRVSSAGSCIRISARSLCPKRPLVGITQALWEALHAGKVSHFLLREETRFVYDRRDGGVNSLVAFEQILEYS